MSYRIEYAAPQTYRDVKSLPAFYRRQAKNIIESLKVDPYPSRSKALRDIYLCRRIWLGDSWRILYQVDDVEQVVYIVAIRPKNDETYQSLELAIPAHKVGHAGRSREPGSDG